MQQEPLDTVAVAPGRVNLIGDHTDHTGGLVLPMAVDLATTVRLRRGGGRVRLVSDADPAPCDVGLEVSAPAAVSPPWARYVAGVVAEVRPLVGATGTVTSTVPVGAGLSSSAALEVAVALALGFEGSALDLALACRRAEEAASGVPCGVMDQVASACGVAGCALLLDCTSLALEPVPVPDGVEVVVVDSGERRALAGSAYAMRREECRRAEALVGPLRSANEDDVAHIPDATLRRRARHVVSENARVLRFVQAMRSGDVRAAGALMWQSHASLRDDFEVSTPALDAVVARLRGEPGVLGARLTGAGFGGSVVALVAAGRGSALGRVVRASAGARLQTSG